MIPLEMCGEDYRELLDNLAAGRCREAYEMLRDATCDDDLNPPPWHLARATAIARDNEPAFRFERDAQGNRTGGVVEVPQHRRAA